jgi:dTDP-glucose 4,6-dehydratase
VTELAELVLELIDTPSRPEYHPLPTDDPTRRRPDISAASNSLGWRPQVGTEDGLRRTVAWFRTRDTHAAVDALVGGQLDGALVVLPRHGTGPADVAV